MQSFCLEFMHLETEGVEFNFDNIVYAQIKRVSISCPLDPVLPNIFGGFYKQLLFEKQKLYGLSYSIQFLHPSLQFIMEVENCILHFLDVLVEHRNGLFITYIYCKSTFTVLYNNWNAFGTKSHKMKLISTLVHCALMIFLPVVLIRN